MQVTKFEMPEIKIALKNELMMMYGSFHRLGDSSRVLALFKEVVRCRDL